MFKVLAELDMLNKEQRKQNPEDNPNPPKEKNNDT